MAPGLENSPASTGSFSAFKDPYHVEGLLPSQRVDRYRACRTSSDHGYTFHDHVCL